MFFHVPGLCLLGIGGAPTLLIKLWLENYIFTYLTSSLNTLQVVRHLMPEDYLNLGHHSLSKIIVKLHIQAFWQKFEKEKMQKFGLCLQDL